MNIQTLLLLRGGYHKEFAFKTLFRKGCKLAMIDRASSSELGWADYPYVIDDLGQPERMAELAKKAHRITAFQGIVTFYDSAVVALAMLSDHFHLDYLSEGTARILTDKCATRDHLAKRGTDSVRHHAVSTLEEVRSRAPGMGFPLILKPADRTAGIGVCVVSQATQLEAAYQQAMAGSFKRSLVMEEYLAGQEYAVEVLVVEARAHVLAISEKHVTADLSCVELIDITPAPLESSRREKIESFVTKVLKEFEVFNHLVHIELRMGADGTCRIIEINPRPSGGNLLESIYHLRGINVYDLLYDLALKKPMDAGILREIRERPFKGHTLFYSFINPTRAGIVKRLEGVELAAGMIDPLRERFSLTFGMGSTLGEVRSNDDVRGFIYLQGENLHDLLSRAKRIEACVKVEYA